MKLSFITDEVTQSFSEAVVFAKAHGFQGLELRSVEDMPIDRIPAATLHAWKRTLDQNGLQVCSLAGSFFKCEPAAPDGQKEELEKLSRLCDAAAILDCRVIRGFAFFAPPSGALPPEALAPLFEQPLRLLEERGKLLALEADPTVNTTNHAALAALLKAIDHPHARAIYDPGNAIYDPLGETPYPDGYDAIKPFLCHVHIKDAVLIDGEPTCVQVGTGLVDYPALLRRLLQEDYQGWLSLETHYRKDVRLTEEQMRMPQGSVFSSGGFEATAESATALLRMLKEARKEIEA